MKAAVILSGCGYLDGAEINESVLTLLALDRRGVDVSVFAPDIPQRHVMNHLTGKEMGGTRNVLVEAARIARGEIRDIRQARVDDVDAVVLPGGFGAAKNLCDFAVHGADCRIQPDVEAFLVRAVKARKALGLICIAPALAARLARELGFRPQITIGNDPGTAAALEAMGARHVTCPVDQCVVDAENRIVTTPAYMLGPKISDVAKGIEQLVDSLVTMCRPEL